MTTDEEARDEITNLIIYLADQINGQEEVVEVQKQSPVTILQPEALPEIRLEEVLLERFQLNQDQSKIVGIVAPRLQEYLNDAYNHMVSLVVKLNEKIKIITGLEKQVEVLTEEIQQTQLELNSLKVDHSNLIEENSKLLRVVEILKEELKNKENP